MKHRLFGKKLGRNHNQRQALFRSLIKELFVHGAINTTQAKAKAVIPSVEKIAANLTQKSDIIASRILFRYFQDRKIVSSLVADFRQVFAGQKSNFSRLKNIKYRQGDNALIVNLSFVKPFPSKPTPKEKSLKTVVKTKKTAKPTKKASKNEK